MSPTVRFHSQPSDEGANSGHLLRRILSDPDLDSFDAVVAWVRFRGLARLRDELRAFKDRGRSRIIVGIDEGGATRPGLVAALRNFSEAYVYHVRGAGTFHPKLYLGSGRGKARLVVGSSNFTPGGLFFNDEVSLESEFALPREVDEPALVDARSYIDSLLADNRVCLPLTAELIEQLVDDPRYRVSDTERRVRRVDAPLPEGAEADDVDDGGESPDDETDVEPIFGASLRTRRGVPGLSPDALAELAELEGDAEPQPVAPPAGGPPRPPAAPPAAPVAAPPAAPVAPPAAPGPPPGAVTVAEEWSKELSRADAQRPERPDTNPTGVLRLSKAGHDIDWRTWFRYTLYGPANWTPTRDTRGNPTETMTTPMTVTIAGVPYGVVNVRVDHAPHREAGQNNVPTVLHWGGTLGGILRATDFHGHTVTLARLSDGTYSLDIS